MLKKLNQKEKRLIRKMDCFKSVKVPLQHILKNPEIHIPKMQDAVLRANKIVIHTLQFLKLYLLNYYDHNHNLLKVDKTLIESCMKILCNKNTSVGRPPKKEIQELKEHLTNFYHTHYASLREQEELIYTHMNTILKYLSTSILTMYENNIKQHYIEYVERYVNVIWKKKNRIQRIKTLPMILEEEKKRAINQLCTQLRRIKKDLLNINKSDFQSGDFYHNWIRKMKEKILPKKDFFNKNNLYYDLQCNPQDYFPCMIFMMKEIEKEGVRLNNVFPLRTEIIPKHIRLDTDTIVKLLITKKQGNKNDFIRHGNLKRLENEIWTFFFRTERKCFRKKNYTFHHMIETDGISCSILFLRKDLVGKKVNSKFNKSSSSEEYIDQLSDYSLLKDKKIVAIDPGKSNLLYCVDGYSKDAKKFRYTQDQRRKESKSKKFRNIQLELKQEIIEDKTVLSYETELSKFNSKTLQVEDFKKYLKKKNAVNSKLFSFYQQALFRKFRLHGYLNRRRSEQRMINRFKKIFGNEKKVVVCFGDFEQKKHMKFKEPTKGKGMRKLFRQNGFQTYLVDEFRTSCKCSFCSLEEGGRCEKFMRRKNPRPWKDNVRLVHGLLKCQTCDGVWNRDCNGAKNIFKISYSAIHEDNRPSYLCRKKRETSSSDVFHDTPKPKFTHSERGKSSSLE